MAIQIPGIVKFYDEKLSHVNPNRRILYFQSTDRDIIRILVDQSAVLRGMLGIECECSYDELCKRKLCCNFAQLYSESESAGAAGKLSPPAQPVKDAQSDDSKKIIFPKIWYINDFQVFTDENKRARMIKCFLDSVEQWRFRDQYPKCGMYLLIASPLNMIPTAMPSEIELIQERNPTQEELSSMFLRQVEEAGRTYYRCMEEKSKVDDARIAREAAALFPGEYTQREIAPALTGFSTSQLEIIFFKLKDDIEGLWADNAKERKAFSKKLRETARQVKTEEFQKTPQITLVDLSGARPVAGLGNYMKWLEEHEEEFKHPESGLKDGIHSPKGVLICGVPGTGKTQIAKQTALRLGVELIKFDVSKINSRYFGESETKITFFLSKVNANSPCVLLIDEIEKTFHKDDRYNGMSDVKLQLLGILLDWLQERTGNVLTFITANDVTRLPPELLRDGRLSARFFAFMPSHDDLMRIFWSKMRDIVESDKLDINFKDRIREMNDDPKKITIPESPMEDPAKGEYGPKGQLCIDNVLDYIVWDEKQKRFYDQPLFMTGANLEALLENVNRAMRTRFKEKRNALITAQDYAEMMVKCARDEDRFTPQGMTNMKDIVNVWLLAREKRYQNASETKILPFDALKDGKFDLKAYPMKTPYDHHMQTYLSSEIEKVEWKSKEREEMLSNARSR